MEERNQGFQADHQEPYIKQGVVVFIQDPEGNIFTIVERENKALTEKREGEVSVICETTDDGENWSTTLERGFQEELGVEIEALSDLLGINPESSMLGRMRFVDGVEATVVRIHCSDVKVFGQRIRPSPEILPGDWMDPESILALPNLRTGVRNVLTRCSQRGVVRFSRNNLVPLTTQSLSTL